MRWMIVLLALAFLQSAALTQAPQDKEKEKEKEKAKEKPKEVKKVERPDPTFADVAYGPHVRNKFDFWQAKSDKPTPVVLLIHGGGWSNGDKSGYGTGAIKPFLDVGISVAAINYRFINQGIEDKVEPPVKAPLHDAARALQFIRTKAKEWNIDKSRFGATGGSAGACTSLWLGYHDDLADPKSEDPIARESTRLQAVAVNGAQTSLDPKQLLEWMPNATYGAHAFAVKGGLKQALEERERLLPWIREFSPIELITKDDPPTFFNYPAQDKTPVIGETQKDPTHSAVYALKVLEKLKELNIEGVLVYPNSEKSKYANERAFLIEKLKG